MFTNSVKNLGLINMVEGYSYLALLFIAMPLKYFFDIPVAVKSAGMAHGVLFIMFGFLLIQAWVDTKWKFKENVIFFIASLIPFGTFYTKNRIKSYE